LKLVSLIGASGSGKSTLLRALEAQEAWPDPCFVYFDDILAEPAFAFATTKIKMEDWQREATLKWCRRLSQGEDKSKVIFMDGQTRYDYLEEGCRLAGLELGAIILLDCDDATRLQRLRDRGQPELGDQQMLDWAAWLRRDALKHRLSVLDTTGQVFEQSLAELVKVLKVYL
jgi:dephospho-CoA kinase